MSIHRITAIMKQSQYTGNDFAIMTALAWHADDDGYCWPSIETIAEFSHVHPRTVIRRLEYLEKSGGLLIKRSRRGHRYLVIVGMSQDDVEKACLTHFSCHPSELRQSPRSDSSVTSEEQIRSDSSVTSQRRRSDNSVTFRTDTSVTSERPRIDTSVTSGSDTSVTLEVTPVSIDQSIMVKEPSIAAPPPDTKSAPGTAMPPSAFEELRTIIMDLHHLDPALQSSRTLATRLALHLTGQSAREQGNADTYRLPPDMVCTKPEQYRWFAEWYAEQTDDARLPTRLETQERWWVAWRKELAEEERERRENEERAERIAREHRMIADSIREYWEQHGGQPAPLGSSGQAAPHTGNGRGAYDHTVGAILSRMGFDMPPEPTPDVDGMSDAEELPF